MLPRGAVPLISPLLYRFSAWRASRRVFAGDLPAVRELAAVFCTSPDPRARSVAARALRCLEHPGQVEALCRECLLRDNDDLAALVAGCGYRPAAPADRILFLFCAGGDRAPGYPDTGKDLRFLSEGYAAADAAVKARARDAARRNGTEKILARALAGDDPARNASHWSYGEWEVVMAGFAAHDEPGDLWLLALLAPYPLAAEAIRLLDKKGWLPPGDDRLTWDELVRALPEQGKRLLPSGDPVPPALNPGGQVSRLCFSHDGSLLAAGCCDGMVTVRRTGSAGPAAEFSSGTGTVTFLGIPAGNTCLVSACDAGAIRCHRIEDHSLLWSWNSGEPGTAAALSADRLTVFAACTSGTLQVLDARDGRELYSLPLHPSPVTCISTDPGKTVACGHADGSVSVVRPGDDSRLRILPGNGSPVLSVSFTSAGTECLVVYERSCPALWDMVSATRTRTFTGFTGRAICCSVPQEGCWFAVGSSDHVLWCWDRAEPAPAARIPFYSRSVTTCSATRDGSLLAAGFLDGSVRIYRMPQGSLLREYKAHRKTVTSCLFDPGSDRLATASWDGTTKLWRIPGMEIVRTFDAHAGGIAALAGPAGNLLAAVTEDGIARVIDGACGRVLRTIDLYTPGIRSAALSPDGTLLATTGTDSTLRCWNTGNGSLVSAGDRHATSHRCCAFLPDGSALVTGGWDGSCRFFSLPDANLIRTLAGHTSTVTCCAVSADGLLLVTGSNDTTVRLWQTGGDEAYAVLGDSRSEVGAVALSPDGTLLATGNREGILRLYRLPYGTPAPGLPGFPGNVTALAFSPDGCILAAGCGDGTCALYSLPERSRICTVPAHGAAVTGLAVLPGGSTLVSTGHDGVCRFHALPRTLFPAGAGLADMPASGPGGPGPGPARFCRALLAARFRDEIGICPRVDTAGCYDIQIAG